MKNQRQQYSNIMMSSMRIYNADVFFVYLNMCDAD